MELKFNIQYLAKNGEALFVELSKKNGDIVNYIQLDYTNENNWQGNIEIESKNLQEKLRYHVLVNELQNGAANKLVFKSFINIGKYKQHKIVLSHKEKFLEIDVRKTKPFKKVFKPVNKGCAKSCTNKKATHIFNISAPLLQPNIFLCITGSAKKMNLFDNERPLLFKKNKNKQSSIKLNLGKEIYPIEYKIAFYDANKKCIVGYEPGNNNILKNQLPKNELHILYSEPDCSKYLWKGAGINVPVFSLRTNDTWGIGDFTTIKKLVDYAEIMGLKMIQLLPVNDTLATFTSKDSYPYSAISSFALHPLYLNVAQIAQAANVFISEAEIGEIERINKLSYCDYSAVSTLKMEVLRRIFLNVKYNFTNDDAWHNFYEHNYEWLIPYSVFCVQRDRYNSVDSSLWEDFESYNIEEILAFVQTTSPFYEAVLFWYFVQYHLHLQLKDSCKYAHKKAIILKADLPIGVAQQSVDTWIAPKIFHRNMQAGAPPDAFSKLGQNWHFPTYNIAQMRLDDFEWFSNRMKNLDSYFDALRIDHVLGLFRIWSIPQNQINGTMGIFVPALALQANDFTHSGFLFNEERLCNPFVTETILADAFGKDVSIIKTTFFFGLNLKEAFDDQQKIEKYLIQNTEFVKYKQQLFDVVANVILLRDFSIKDRYHFRINMQQTTSYQYLTATDKQHLEKPFNHYFFENQNELWEYQGTATLKMLTTATKMLLCAEDLGMVPAFTEKVLQNLNILSLQVQQMPKKSETSFSDTKEAPYACVVMPATHDMAPIRLWWEENKQKAQDFYNNILKEPGAAPYFCEPWVCKKIIDLHLQSPAMWSVFLLQDLLAVNGKIRRPIPAEERINDPSNAEQIWNYRMHVTLETLMEQEDLNSEIKEMILEAGR